MRGRKPPRKKTAKDRRTASGGGGFASAAAAKTKSRTLTQPSPSQGRGISADPRVSVEVATLIQAERELLVIVEALSCLPDLAAMARGVQKSEDRDQRSEVRDQRSAVRTQNSELRTEAEDDDDEVDDPRLLPYVVNARSVVDSVICIAAWRLKQLAGRLRRLRKE